MLEQGPATGKTDPVTSAIAEVAHFITADAVVTDEMGAQPVVIEDPQLDANSTSQ